MCNEPTNDFRDQSHKGIAVRSKQRGKSGFRIIGFSENGTDTWTTLVHDPKCAHIYHSIICIGALVAHREETGCWTVDALGAPHVGERSEKELIASFVEKIAAFSPQLGVMGLPGKPDGMTGAEVEKYYRDGHIREIAEYCESEVLNTYRVWLRYELFRGRLSEPEFQGSEANLTEFVKVRSNTKPHLSGLM